MKGGKVPGSFLSQIVTPFKIFLFGKVPVQWTINHCFRKIKVLSGIKIKLFCQQVFKKKIKLTRIVSTVQYSNVSRNDFLFKKCFVWFETVLVHDLVLLKKILPMLPRILANYLVYKYLIYLVHIYCWYSISSLAILAISFINILIFMLCLTLKTAKF